MVRGHPVLTRRATEQSTLLCRRFRRAGSSSLRSRRGTRSLPAQSTVIRVDELLKRLPEAVERFRRMGYKLSDAPIDVERGRAVLKSLLGPILISPRDGYQIAQELNVTPQTYESLA